MGVILIGAIGVPFYQHTCLHENETHQSIFVPSTTCADEHLREVVPPCCKAQQNTEEATFEEACCLDEVSNWQFSFFFFQEIHPVINQLGELFSIRQLFADLVVGWIVSDEVLFSPTDPPLIRVFERLTSWCVWRL